MRLVGNPAIICFRSAHDILVCTHFYPGPSRHGIPDQDRVTAALTAATGETGTSGFVSLALAPVKTSSRFRVQQVRVMTRQFRVMTIGLGLGLGLGVQLWVTSQECEKLGSPLDPMS